MVQNGAIGYRQPCTICNDRRGDKGQDRLFGCRG